MHASGAGGSRSASFDGIREEVKDFSHQFHEVLKSSLKKSETFESLMSPDDIVTTSAESLASLRDFTAEMAMHITPEDKAMTTLKLPFDKFRDNFKELEYLRMFPAKKYLMLEKLSISHGLRTEISNVSTFINNHELSERIMGMGRTHR